LVAVSVFDELVGENVRRFRVAAGMSQADLATQMGASSGESVHQQTIQKIEKGTRALKFSEALKIAEALKVDVVSLTAVTARGLVEAEFLNITTRLTRFREEITTLASRLSPVIDELRIWTAAYETTDMAHPELIEAAREGLDIDWGAVLNRALEAQGVDDAET
jgi:transcriptional regulator with XRE-family HTH domain